MPASRENMFYVETDSDRDGEWIYSDYTMRWKCSNGDLVEIRLLEIPETRCKHFNWRGAYNVCLWIGKRKKGFVRLEQTGKCGLEGLSAALIMMKELIRCMFPGERLIVFADDERRWKIYYRYLIPLGFKIENDKVKIPKRQMIYTKK